MRYAKVNKIQKLSVARRNAERPSIIQTAPLRMEWKFKKPGLLKEVDYSFKIYFFTFTYT